MPGGLRNIFGGKKEADTFEEILSELGKHEGIKGSLIVDSEGLLVAELLPKGELEPAQMGSLISVFRRFIDSWSSKFRKGKMINEIVLKGGGNWIVVRNISELTLAVLVDPYQSRKLDIEDSVRAIRGIFDRKSRGGSSSS